MTSSQRAGVRDGASVSVVIPAYNAQRSIGAAISSACGQSRRPAEILVVDDGSTDATAAIAGAYPEPVRLLRRENGGVSSARNTALEQVAGDFVALLDADDQLLPNHLERCLETWRRKAEELGHERVIVTSNAYRLTTWGLTDSTVLPRNFPKPEFQRERILQANFVSNFAVYPRKLHDDIGFYDPALSHGEDLDLWVRAIFSGWQIVQQAQPHAIYRMGTTNMSADLKNMSSAELVILRKTLQGFGAELTAAEKSYLETRLSMRTPRELVAEANELIRSAEWSEAEGRLRAATAVLPWDRNLWARSVLARYRLSRPILSLLLRASDQKLGRISTGN